MSDKIKVGVVGGTGYTGVELLRLLARHPNVDLKIITSRAEAGRPVSELFPNLRHVVDLAFSGVDDEALAQCDLVYFATPNGVAMKAVPQLLAKGVKVIDLAADFRIKDIATWEHWYGMPHECPEAVAEAVYGLPEVNREQVRQARLIANPGCYPTSVQLGLLPLLEQGLIEHSHIVADCKSGVSGAGRKADVGTSLCEVSESFKAYAVSGHRHLPEIKQGLEQMAGAPVGLVFVPHLTPMMRGIHATIYVKAKPGTTLEQVQTLYEQRYAQEAFVDVLPAAGHPETRSVRGSNLCRIAIHQPQNGNDFVILSVIDNLVKGAAGQAVQNMNVMFGLEEITGLTEPAIIP